MKTENYLGMIAHIALPPKNKKTPRLATRAGFDFIVETCHGASLRMGYGITPCCGIRQQYRPRYSTMISMAWNWLLPELVCGNSLRIGNNRKDNVHKNNKGQTRTRRFAPSFQFSVLSSSVFYTTH